LLLYQQNIHWTAAAVSGLPAWRLSSFLFWVGRGRASALISLQTAIQRNWNRSNLFSIVEKHAPHPPPTHTQTIHRSRCSAIYSFYAFKCKHFRNTRHTITFGLPL
jgi:hypothetical protein